MKKVAVLGSTGSVGRSTLKVIDQFPGSFEVVLLAAFRSSEVLVEQAKTHRPQVVCVVDETAGKKVAEALRGLPIAVEIGYEAMIAAVSACGASMTVSAIVGAAGLKPTMAAIRAGSNIGLANKESMVVAGAFMHDAAEAAGVGLLPIDSEHNALHQCLRGEAHDEVRRLILTASGGPFRTYEGDLAAVTPEQALNHPTWDMGPKITIDSATMMNKGLEVIEASYLFGFPAEQISVVVHPQSLVHSMIETVDGSYKAQISKTDMCDPIQYALTFPERRRTPFETLDITRGLELSFFPVDHKRFPCVDLAYQALRAGGTAPTVLNAANEIAVEAFLQKRIRFTQIAELNARCLESAARFSAENLDDLLAVDEEIRAMARSFLSD